jgi:hypothetical protein
MVIPSDSPGDDPRPAGRGKRKARLVRLTALNCQYASMRGFVMESRYQPALNSR